MSRRRRKQKKHKQFKPKEFKPMDYWYCIYDNDPISGNKGSYVYYLNEKNERQLVSPLFPDTCKLKDWMKGKYELDPWKPDGEKSYVHTAFRLKRIDLEVNKKTQKIPEIVTIEVVEPVSTISKSDEYIQLIAGSIKLY